MCKLPRAVQVTGKMLHIQSVWKRLLKPITHIFIFKRNVSFHVTVTSILSLSFIFLYIVYTPVIVIGTNYFVLWNDFHITV